MKRVVDASVAVKWLVEEAGSPEARALLGGSRLLLAPALLIAEVTNTAWKKVARGEITADQAAAVVSTMPRMFETLHPLEPLAARALVIAMALQHPAYDGFYVALAEAESAMLVSDDCRLLARVHGTEWEPLVTPLRAA